MADFRVIITYPYQFKDYYLLRWKCRKYLSNKKNTYNVIVKSTWSEMIDEYVKEDNLAIIHLSNDELFKVEADALIAFSDGKDEITLNLIKNAKEKGLQTKVVTVPQNLTFSEALEKSKDLTGLLTFQYYLPKEDYITYSKGNGVLFCSKSPIVEARILSNHAECDLLLNGIHFNGIEQLYYTLRFYEYPNIQRELLKYNAYEVKTIARKYLHLIRNQGDGFLANLLMFCHRVKMKQCRQFRDYIESKVMRLESKGRKIEIIPTLIEYCCDWTDYKNGAVDKEKENRNDWENGEVEGENRCGRMMRRVFQEYKKGLLEEPIPLPYPYLTIYGNPVHSV